MSRDYRLYLDNIQFAGAKILEYAHGQSFAEFTADNKIFDAVVLNLKSSVNQQITCLLKFNHATQVDWRRPVGLCNVIAHQYFTLSDQIVWDIVQNRVPPLLTKCVKSWTKNLLNELRIPFDP